MVFFSRLYIFLCEFILSFIYKIPIIRVRNKTHYLWFINSKIILPNNLFYSQDQQELIILYYFNKYNLNLNNLKIIDIGANHPIKINNTFFFEKYFNSTTYSFEPNLYYKKLWSELRPNSKVFFSAIGNLNLNTLFVPKNFDNTVKDLNVYGTLNTPNNVSTDLYDILNITTGSIEDFIKKDFYDLLFIDTEGFELNVLKSINFSDFKFKFIIVENNKIVGGDKNIRDILFHNSYKLICRTYNLDDFYIHKDIYYSL
jgi:FkbM family methyltransferase